jgi:hypothetical protein
MFLHYTLVRSVCLLAATETGQLLLRAPYMNVFTTSNDNEYLNLMQQHL